MQQGVRARQKLCREANVFTTLSCWPCRVPWNVILSMNSIRHTSGLSFLRSRKWSAGIMNSTSSRTKNLKVYVIRGHKETWIATRSEVMRWFGSVNKSIFSRVVIEIRRGKRVAFRIIYWTKINLLVPQNKLMGIGSFFPYYWWGRLSGYVSQFQQLRTFSSQKLFIIDFRWQFGTQQHGRAWTGKKENIIIHLNCCLEALQECNVFNIALSFRSCTWVHHEKLCLGERGYLLTSPKIFDISNSTGRNNSYC